jgi:hypothetical protein
MRKNMANKFYLFVQEESGGQKVGRGQKVEGRWQQTEGGGQVGEERMAESGGWKVDGRRWWRVEGGGWIVS